MSTDQPYNKPLKRKYSLPDLMWALVLLAGVLFGSFLIRTYENFTYDVNKDGVQLSSGNPKPAADTPVVPQVKKPKPVNIYNQVSVKGSEYTVGLLGGIRDLKLTINNRSPFKIEKVTVEVTYLKPNGETLKKESHSARTIAAKSTKTIIVPDTDRGVDATFRITNISSSQYRAALSGT
ncbi:MAG: hypothetical protein ABR502_11220 [Chitinophagaceae bacterium]